MFALVSALFAATVSAVAVPAPSPRPRTSPRSLGQVIKGSEEFLRRDAEQAAAASDQKALRSRSYDNARRSYELFNRAIPLRNFLLLMLK